jgi:hypothetical protein
MGVTPSTIDLLMVNMIVEMGQPAIISEISTRFTVSIFNID